MGTLSDDKLLWELSDALSKVQLDVAGEASELGYTPEQVAAGRRILIEFPEILARGISTEKQKPSYDEMTEKELAAGRWCGPSGWRATV